MYNSNLQRKRHIRQCFHQADRQNRIRLQNFGLGEFWTRRIYSDAESDREGGQGHNLSHFELISSLEKLIDVTERIKTVWIFRCPLFDGQITMRVLHHAFVVFETNSWFWSLEKNNEGLTIQRSKKREYVQHHYRRTPRRTPVVSYDYLYDAKINLAQLIKWLYDSMELYNTYHWLRDNCKHFARRVFEKCQKLN